MDGCRSGHEMYSPRLNIGLTCVWFEPIWQMQWSMAPCHVAYFTQADQPAWYYRGSYIPVMNVPFILYHFQSSCVLRPVLLPSAVIYYTLPNKSGCLFLSQSTLCSFSAACGEAVFWDPIESISCVAVPLLWQLVWGHCASLSNPTHCSHQQHMTTN